MFVCFHQYLITIFNQLGCNVHVRLLLLKTKSSKIASWPGFLASGKDSRTKVALARKLEKQGLGTTPGLKLPLRSDNKKAGQGHLQRLASWTSPGHHHCLWTSPEYKLSSIWRLFKTWYVSRYNLFMLLCWLHPSAKVIMWHLNCSSIYGSNIVHL